jgi:hypothetical protein
MGSTYKACRLCIVCKNRTPYKEYNVLCIVCMSHVAHDIEAQIKRHGPIAAT